MYEYPGYPGKKKPNKWLSAFKSTAVITTAILAVGILLYVIWLLYKNGYLD